MRTTITISVSDEEAAVIRRQAQKFDSVSHYVRMLVHRDANRLTVPAPVRRLNDYLRREVPAARRCARHSDIPRGNSLTVTLTDAAIDEWL